MFQLYNQGLEIKNDNPNYARNVWHLIFLASLFA